MLSIVLNVAIAAMTLVAWLMILRGRGDDRSLAASGVGSLKYYTVLSNLLSAVASIAYVAWGGTAAGAIPAGILALKLAGATGVMLTFATVVLLLGPTLGWEHMYTGGNFWLHLVLPLAAALDVCLLDPTGTLGLAWTLLPVAFTAAYAAWYACRVLACGDGQARRRRDFYGFLRWGVSKVALVALAMLAATWAIAVLLWLASRL